MDKKAEEIKTTLLELIADYKDNVFTDPKELGDLLLVEFFFNKLDATSIAEKFVKNILPYKKEIEKRELKFFIRNKDTLFSNLPKEKVDYFIDKIQKPEKEGGIANDHKEVTWEYIDKFVELCEEYKKNK